jgi:diguanylate cyclase (GGDEF)-like protein
MRLRLTVITFATDKHTVAETTSSQGPLMHEVNEGDSSSRVLARRGLLITSILALTGAGVGTVCIPLGMVAGIEIALVLSCVLFTSGVLVTLLCFPRVALQTVATVSTIYFAVNLTSGAMIAILGHGERLNLFVYLVWFFPLLVFNKLVNQPAMGRFLAHILLATPLFAVGLLFPRLLVVLKTPQMVLLLVYCLSYACYAAMLNVVTRYREAYIVECARVASLNTDITNRRAAEARIEHLAFFDVLTELPNRLLLRERLERTLATAIQRGNTGALLFIDLDDFKTINDTLGHRTGDVVLQQVALRLTACVRQSDTVARLGGDEFAMMLEGLSADAEVAIAEAKAIGDKVLRAFLQPYNLGNYEYAAKASIGITLFPMWSGSVDELLKRAELAVYQAKARGRNMLCFFEPAMQQLVDSRAELQSDLRRALHNGEFQLHYQPQVDNGGHVTGAEGLLRWKHPRRGMVPPGAFIPLVEEAGLIIELGRWVLQSACSQLAQWAIRPECERLILAVNVSIRQFLDANFVGLVREVIRSSGANPHRLKLEITESAMLENAEDTIAKMTALKESGVGFSLDDFGTGYSSLSRLRRLPLDQLKIDASFIKDALTDHRGAAIVRTVIMLGKSLNLSVIAEGVETEGQRQFLEEEGCYTYQGYLFAAALTAARFEIFVATGSLV